MKTNPSTALIPYVAPLVALITPNAPISRAALLRLLEDGHDVTAIARFHRLPGNSLIRYSSGG